MRFKNFRVENTKKFLLKTFEIFEIQDLYQGVKTFEVFDILKYFDILNVLKSILRLLFIQNLPNLALLFKKFASS